MKPHVCYLLEDPPMSGPLNMAVDEVLLEAVAETDTPVLRFYSWSEPTLSLGYFQAAAERELHAASVDCPLVRRATGGGAILHDRELTYSLIWPKRIPPPAAKWEATGTEWMYQWVHQSLIDVLGQHGVDAVFAQAPQDEIRSFLCFERRSRWDIVVDGIKILGSAQRSRRQGVLQHGSLLFSASPFAPQLEGLSERGLTLPNRKMMKLWASRIAANASLVLKPLQLDATQRQSIRRLADEKYGSQKWTKRR